MKITKAVIAVAGHGTRRLPITRAIEKCMLPIGNRPVVDYIVEACVDAGIKEVAFVVGPNSSQIQTYFQDNVPLKNLLVSAGKEQLLPLAGPVQYKGISFKYIIQPESAGYGSAVPLTLSYKFLAGEDAFLFVSGDDFLWSAATKKSTDIDLLVHEAQVSHLPAMLVAKMPVERSKTMGVAKIEGKLVASVIDGCKISDGSTSFWANVSKYVLNQQILKLAISHSKLNPFLARSKSADNLPEISNRQ